MGGARPGSPGTPQWFSATDGEREGTMDDLSVRLPSIEKQEAQIAAAPGG